MFILWFRQAPQYGIRPLLHPLRADSVLIRLMIFPPVLSSYWVLRGSIYSFPLVRHSCLLSADVLITCLCLKVYAWCIHREMYSTSTYSSTILFSHLKIVLEHRIHSGSRCAIKCEFRHTPEGKLSDFSTADLKHWFTIGQTHGSNIMKIIYGVPILEHKISRCVTFAVECKFSCGKRYAPQCNWDVLVILW
jgi:hypothetical protein